MKYKFDMLGNRFWYNSDGQLHREDGRPAVEYQNGSKFWYINGLQHRDNGPAYIDSDGTVFWWINGNHITNEVKQWIKDNNFPEYEEWDDNVKVLFKLKFG